MRKHIGRRNFLKLAGIGAGGVGVFALSQRGGLVQGKTPTGSEHVGDVFLQEGMDAETMDAMHDQVVKTFLDYVGQDTRFWNNVLEPEMDGDVKVFNIVCQDIEWETGPGMVYNAMAYNGSIPGPEIRVTEGDKVRFVVKNEMVQSTAIHWHGVIVPNSMDGVPYITQLPIKTGETFTYEFVARNAGSHMYHSHHNAAEQTAGGLFGGFIIEPKDKSREPEVSAEYILTVNDTILGFTINGKVFPYTQPIVAKLGDRIRIRYMNEGFMIHPMHLHGLPQLVFAKDGWNLPVPYMADTLNIAPGERYDVTIDCTEPGVWAFHCHILTHAESRAGMYGMVTVLIIQE